MINAAIFVSGCATPWTTPHPGFVQSSLTHACWPSLKPNSQHPHVVVPMIRKENGMTYPNDVFTRSPTI
ncbi:hypothetical protein [Paenibacillus lutimineralis]|uniref:hypothetical protein n=1 Tax=Paenibacillus lutimineralis TaxID=2707005 RepID=UPI0013A62226|nr:hypothetical protein [Paenibacillus lutimineralis]